MLHNLRGRRSFNGTLSSSTRLLVIKQLVEQYNRTTGDDNLWMIVTGGFGLRMQQELNSVTYGDVDIFFGYIGNSQKAREFCQSLRRVFGGTPERDVSSVGNTLFNSKFSVDGVTYNIILQNVLNSPERIERLLNGFDMDILQSCWYMDQVNITRQVGTRKFLESLQSKVVTCSDSTTMGRKEKYKERLRSLGFDFSWEME